MDKYDPDKRVSLIVDEWGTWYDVEQGTETGFLYQQNTIRDAVVAALNLNIFHRHADRVRMTNIAQMVNVLQAMLLTDGGRLVKTPTYHVFDLYTDHQDAEWVDAAADDVDPFLDWTVSRKDGAYTIGLVNTGLEREATTSLRLPSAIADVLSARLLVGETPDAHNTFDAPDAVAPLVFDGYRVEGDTVTVTLPPRAVASLRVAVAA